MKTSDRFWEALKTSVVMSSLLAILVWGAIVYLAVTQTEVPEVLVLGGGSILGYFFGTRSGQQTERIQASNAVIRARLQEVATDA